ncbi:NADH dehydrogenase [ubiquinone] 1 alpha subcomplex assembly factor 8 [Ctenodactylus gundi]
MAADAAVWLRVRSRLRAFPERLAACGAEAAAYGRCVRASTAPGGRLSQDLCAREFEALRSCFVAAVGGRSPSAASRARPACLPCWGLGGRALRAKRSRARPGTCWPPGRPALPPFP